MVPFIIDAWMEQTPRNRGVEAAIRANQSNPDSLAWCDLNDRPPKPTRKAAVTRVHQNI
jgi:hypothetical protein